MLPLKSLANLPVKKRKSSFVKLPKAVSKLSINLKNFRKLSAKFLANLILHKSLNIMSNSTNLIIPSIIIIMLHLSKKKKTKQFMMMLLMILILNPINTDNILPILLMVNYNLLLNCTILNIPTNFYMFMMKKIMDKLCSLTTSTNQNKIKLMVVIGIWKVVSKLPNLKSAIIL